LGGGRHVQLQTLVPNGKRTRFVKKGKGVSISVKDGQSELYACPNGALRGKLKEKKKA